MAAHRYWRLTGFSVDGAGPLELSEARLYGGGALVDSSATLTCPFAPASGALTALTDGVATAVVSWPFVAHRSSGFALVWDLGASGAADVDALRLGSGTSAGTFPANLTLQYSDDGVVWVQSGEVVNATYPGPLALTPLTTGGGTSWDTEVNPTTMVLSGDGLLVTRSGTPTTGYLCARGLVPITQKRYWEIEILSGGATTPPYGLLGVMTLAAATGTFLGAGAGGWGYHTHAGHMYFEGATQIGFPISGVGDTVMFAFDATTGKLWFGRNGVWFASGNPATGTGAQTTVSGTVYPATSLYDVGARQVARFSGGHVYTPPFGFSPLDEKLLLPKEVRHVWRPSAAPVQFPGDVLPAGAATSHLRGRTFFDAYHGGIGIIYGTVKEKNTPANTPLRRRVLLVDEASRLTIRETWSDVATGNYEFRGVKEGVKYTVVSYDHSGAYRAVVADNLTLANGGVELMP